MRPRDIFAMLKEAFQDWNEDNAPRLGAALSYYTIFSIAPLLLISVAVAGLVFGADAAQGRVVAQIQAFVGRAAAEAIQDMIESARKPGQGVMATVLGTATLLFGAGGAFNELRGALDVIWEIPPRKSGGLMAIVHDRIASFGMVLVVGFLLLVSLVLSAGISAFEFEGTFLGSAVVLQAVNQGVSLVIITVLFALIFKYLPDAHPPVAWKDIWVGAFVTSALFTLGKYAIGLYLGRSSVASAYGAAGSVVLLLVWVYYSAQILFFGAELTQVYARRHGSRLGLPEATAAPTAPNAPTRMPASPRDAGRTVWTRAPAPLPPRFAPPPAAVGRGLAISAVLLLLGSIGRRKRLF